MRSIIATFKFIIYFLILLSYFLLTLPLLPFVSAWPNKFRKMTNKFVQNYSKFLLWLANVEVSEECESLVSMKGKLIVSNHLSYLDILIIASRYPCSFVTSMEMRRVPILGQICLLAGCLFVDRKNKRNLSQEVKQITQALKSGINVTIFPEATSTNGEGVLRFRRPLFQSALDAQVECIPFILNYTSISGRAMDVSNRDIVCWYDDMTFSDHLWTLFKEKKITVKLTIGSQLSPLEFQETTTFCEAAYRKVLNHYIPVVVEM